MDETTSYKVWNLTNEVIVQITCLRGSEPEQSGIFSMKNAEDVVKMLIYEYNEDSDSTMYIQLNSKIPMKINQRQYHFSCDVEFLEAEITEALNLYMSMDIDRNKRIFREIAVKTTSNDLTKTLPNDLVQMITDYMKT